MINQFRAKTSIFLTTLAVCSSFIVAFPVKSQSQTGAQVIYVNPTTGENTAQAGISAARPYKTITFALASNQVKAGTVIQLAPGNYASEAFPIKIKEGVTLQGNESTSGEKVVISGGGDYVSRIWAKQNITILANQDSTIAGLTVTNTNQSGTGVWVESTNPTIKNSTFINNGREGIFITGTGNPKIENNRFINNSANGIAVTTSSQGEISNNLFQNNGFGLVIGNDSRPSLKGNQILQNKDGIVISEDAKPLLRDNKIQDNKRDGVVIIHRASPDLGTSKNQGGNIIANNSRYNVHNATNFNTMFDTFDTPKDSASSDSTSSNLASSDSTSSDTDKKELLIKWGLTPTGCNSGSKVVTIIMGRGKYCIEPHPDLTATRYRYNSKTGSLKAIADGL